MSSAYLGRELTNAIHFFGTIKGSGVDCIILAIDVVLDYSLCAIINPRFKGIIQERFRARHLYLDGIVATVLN
jgi:hypothetical protein